MNQRIQHIVPVTSSRDRLDRYLATFVPETSRAQIQRWITGGHVRVNGNPARASQHVAPGEKIDVEIPPPEPMKLEPDESITLKVLYEDKRLLLVDKPAGLVVHPAPGHPSGTLVNALLAHGRKFSQMAGLLKPGIVHRLDKDTSGILLIAKDDEAHRRLSAQFAEARVKRVYLAIVQGIIQQQEGTIDAPLGRHRTHRQKMAVQPEGEGRHAVTRYRVLERFKKATYVQLLPQTGRTHQLRVHLAHIGHPILGDLRYGVQAGLSRQALHAHRLGFYHPADERFLEVVSDLPVDLQQALECLRNG